MLIVLGFWRELYFFLSFSAGRLVYDALDGSRVTPARPKHESLDVATAQSTV